MVLTGLLFKYFIDNLSSFPDHFIHVRKQDVLNIKSIIVKHEYSLVSLTCSTIHLPTLYNLGKLLIIIKI
jgi:hypothetical protein